MVMIMCLVFTTSMVCTMDSCPMMGDISKLAPKETQKQPCHGMSDTADIGLVIDCIDLDLFQNGVEQKSQLSKNSDLQDFDWDIAESTYAFQRRNRHDIRGPPLITDASSLQFSILLSTQRFRI